MYCYRHYRERRFALKRSSEHRHSIAYHGVTQLSYAHSTGQVYLAGIIPFCNQNGTSALEHGQHQGVTKMSHVFAGQRSTSTVVCLCNYIVDNVKD